MNRGDHGHLLAGHGPSPDLLSEHEEREREIGFSGAAVDGSLVDERCLRLHRQNLPLLLMIADIRIEAHAQQRYHNV